MRQDWTCNECFYIWIVYVPMINIPGCIKWEGIRKTIVCPKCGSNNTQHK
jgi:rubredoxin